MHGPSVCARSKKCAAGLSRKADCQKFPQDWERLHLSKKSSAWQRQTSDTAVCSPAMKLPAYILAVICAIGAVMYYVTPGGSLPTFMPGYNLGSTHIHTMHAVAAATAAIVFLLIGLSARR
jgi:hypothetical protein